MNIKKKRIIGFGIVTSICILGAAYTCAAGRGNKTVEASVQDEIPQEQEKREEREAREEREEREAREERPESHVIENFPIIGQMPELPTGCEITAMTMAMDYYGLEVDKVTMAAEYLPTAPANLYYGSDGRLYGSDMYSYFIGDPASELGCICGPGAIVSAADRYFSDHNIHMHAVDLSGADPSELYDLVGKDIPVVVWVTIGMADRRPAEGWYTESGNYVDWSRNDHGAVLIGYTDETVTMADPISGMTEYDRMQFEKVFASRGYQCVILEDD